MRSLRWTASDTDVWQREAKAVIADELTPYADRLQREVSRSSVLSAGVKGMRTLAIAGVSGAAGTTMAGGDHMADLGALGGTAAASLLSGLSDLAKSRRRAVPTRAVLQLAMVFSEDT